MIQMPIGWYFPKNLNQGEENNDKFIDSKFAMDSWMSFTREVIQNSLDAKDPNLSEPVKIIFQYKQISINQLPGGKRLKDIIQLCADQTTSPQTRNAYINGVNKLSAKHIDCLKVSDFNTTGILEGRNNKWGKLLNDTGSSDKSSKTSAGSHGLGKRTSFLVSSINTVFYSTLYKNNESSQLVSLFQGRSILINWTGEDNDRKSLDGWFGSNNDVRDIREISLPIKNQELNSIDEFFVRKDKIGADVIIPAISINNIDDTKGKIILSIIENFFVAILENKVELEVFGEVINKNTFDDITRRYYNRNSKRKTKAKSANLREGNLLMYLRAYPKSEPVIINIESEQTVYGNLRVYFTQSVDDNFKFYSLFRSHGMKIQDIRISSDKPFSAVVVIEGFELNRLLLKIENPAHDDFEVDGKFVNNEDKEINLAIKLAKLVWKEVESYIYDQTKLVITKEYLLDDVSSYLSIQGSTSTVKIVKPTIIQSKKRKKGKNSSEKVEKIEEDPNGSSNNGKKKRKKYGLVKDEKLITDFEIEPIVLFNGETYQITFKTKKEIEKVNILLTAEKTNGRTNKILPLIEQVNQNGRLIKVTNNNIKNVELIEKKLLKLDVKLKTNSVYKLIPEIYEIHSNNELEKDKD
jgi:hypothetical protein